MEENVKAIKAILWSFELVSGLKINFSKSSFGVVGMLERWKEDAAMFLNCSLLVIPFLYLGTLIGTNPRVPNKILDKLVRIQQRFLWGGGLEQRKIAQWRWNLFHNQRELWARVLVSKYGEWSNWDEVRRGNTKSSWWKGIRSIAHSTEEGSWFVKGIKRNLGCRARVQFWEDDGVTLMLKYPRLYSISPINNNNPFNRWEVSQPLFDAEIDLATKFLEEMDGIIIYPDHVGNWTWKGDSSGVYTMGNAYAMLMGDYTDENQDGAFNVLWKVRVPSKSTKTNLRKRHVEINDPMSPFCRSSEDATHLFFSCSKILPLWWKALSWTNRSGAFLQCPRQHFLQYALGKTFGRWQCWWISLTWNIWHHRNIHASKLMEEVSWMWLKLMDKGFDLPFHQWSSNLRETFCNQGGMNI
ncbi:hypothetical protein HKD37_03G006389 [Glycine soja]